MRRFFGLAIAAIGLSAPLASAATVPVINGSFETEFGTNTDSTLNWAKLTSWTFNNTNTAILPIGTAFTTDASGAGSGNYTRFTYNTAGIVQNLNTTVSAGDTISVSFSVGSNATTESNFTVNPARVKGYAYFLVGTTRYDMPFNLAATPTNGVWVPMTFTTTVTNTGNLTLGFQNYRATDPGSNNSYYTSLDGVSDVTWTPATNELDAPTSTGATLAALENTATPLAEGDFGYADPNSSPLANVQIVSLPALGTLTYNGSPVANNDIIAAADIGNLSYLSPLGGFGSPYTTMTVKVQNSALPTGLWSLPATMTVNVTDVNHAPTSTGGAVTMSVLAGPSLAFATANFNFSDIDAGDTLQAVKVTSLPTNGTLSLSASAVTLDQVVDVADIAAGNLIYTPTVGYTGADTYNFQVRDAALYSADATMAITVTSDIIVQNGSFETPGLNGAATYWWSIGSPWTCPVSGPYQELNFTGFDQYAFNSGADGIYGANMDTGYISYDQDLSTTVNAGDTLSVTFSGGKPKTTAGGSFTLTFLVGTTEYTSPVIDTTLQAANTWQSYTFTTPIANTGNLSLSFRAVSSGGWLDKVSNVSVTTGSGPTPVSFADWATTNGVTGGVSGDSNNDGVQNGVAYFMGVTGLATNPGLDASNQVIWPMSPTFSGTYEVQTSSDLSTWTAASPQPTASGGNLTYTLPSGLGTQFVRLVVTPN